MPVAFSPLKRISSTSEREKYSTPSFFPAATRASLSDWLAPIAIAAASNDSASGKTWIKPCKPITSSPKQPVEVAAARMNSVLSSGLSKKSHANWLSVMN